MKPLAVGAIGVSRVVESEGLSFMPDWLLPDWTEEIRARHDAWLTPRFLAAESGHFIMSVHSYVIRTRHHTILVDTCVGNDKVRTQTPAWNLKTGPFLADLLAAGAAPEAVDFVLCTHLHVDHVGWNTRLVDGRWVPTFPNAKYLFCQTEFEHWAAEAKAAGDEDQNAEAIRDSVLPIVEAGQAVLVAGDFTLDDQVWLQPTPGHTPGHVCINLADGGARALLTGDLMHHPVQIAEHQLSSRFCVDPAASAATRKRVIEANADTGTLILAAHFASPTVGRIQSHGDGFRFDI